MAFEVCSENFSVMSSCFAQLVMNCEADNDCNFYFERNPCL